MKKVDSNVKLFGRILFLLRWEQKRLAVSNVPGIKVKR